MTNKKCLLFALALLSAAPLAYAADYHSARQYYGNWQRHPQNQYHYRNYYYKPSSAYAGYRHHYVIHSPRDPQHLYFYNPYSQKYWGRCPSQSQGKPLYSMLAEADRKSNLEEIPERAFPTPSSPPAIPEATDSVQLDLPPDDLPVLEGLPK